MEVLYLLMAFTGQVYCQISAGENPCQPGDTEVLPHPDQCHMYYDCARETKGRSYLGKNLVECPYPYLFDTISRSCAHFEKVICGSRYAPVNGCEYVSNQCIGAHCRPCYLEFSECKGLPDGPNLIPHLQGSPFYAFCYKDRFLAKMTCPEDTTGPMIYDGSARNCVKNPNVVPL